MSILKKDGFEYTFDSSLCSNCNGNCCIGESGYIWISKDEIINLSKGLNLEVEEFSSRYLIKIGYRNSLKEIEISPNNFACIFFNIEKKQCNIYEYRPNQCRTFPFWEYFKINKEELLKECKAVLYT